MVNYFAAALTNEDNHRDEDVRKPSSIHYSLGEFELVDDGEEVRLSFSVFFRALPHLSMQQHAIELPQVEREGPLTAAEWRAAFDLDGRVSDPGKIKRRVFKGVRLVLLVLHSKQPTQSTRVSRTQSEKKLGNFCWDIFRGTQLMQNVTPSLRRSGSYSLQFFLRFLVLIFLCREEYLVYKRQWQSISPEQEKHFAKFRNRRSRVGTRRAYRPSERIASHFG
jgi:hypothetical protein